MRSLTKTVFFTSTISYVVFVLNVASPGMSAQAAAKFGEEDREKVDYTVLR